MLYLKKLTDSFDKKKDSSVFVEITPKWKSKKWDKYDSFIGYQKLKVHTIREGEINFVFFWYSR